MLNRIKFKQAIKLNFRDIDEQRTAQQYIKCIKQKGSAIVYIAKYQRIVAVLIADKETLVEGLYNTLKEEVKDEISRMAEQPRMLLGMIKVIVRIDN